ncbi:MAG: GNAT family N-acetyltransferase [Acidimicrobiales bacterium]
MTDQSEDRSTPDVVDNDAHSRLEYVDGDLVAELRYRVDGGELEITHTEVPEELGGQGLGGRLVQAAITKAARDDLVVVPTCPFARDWIDEHPDEASVVTVRRVD